MCRIDGEWYGITPRGPVQVFMVIDSHISNNPQLLVVHADTREMFCVDCREFRMEGNAMWDIPDPKPFEPGQRDI